MFYLWHSLSRAYFRIEHCASTVFDDALACNDVDISVGDGASDRCLLADVAAAHSKIDNDDDVNNDDDDEYYSCVCSTSRVDLYRSKCAS